MTVYTREKITIKLVTKHTRISEIHNYVESPSTRRTRPSSNIPVPSAPLVNCSVGGNVIPPRFFSSNVDPYCNVPPRSGFEPLGRYNSGEWSEDDNVSHLAMRPDEEYGWPSPPPPPPIFTSFPRVLHTNVDPCYDVPPPNNDFVPFRRYYRERSEVEHLSRFAMRREEELYWNPPPCPSPPIFASSSAFPINSGNIVEEPFEDENIEDLDDAMDNIPHQYRPWKPDDSTDEEPYFTMHCCNSYVP